MKTTGQQSSPEVTVLLSVYNGEETLDRCLESIVSQTFSNFHIICVNDASTDKSQTILEAWKNQVGNKMTLIHNETNIGLTRSLNKGIDAVTTPFIARIDADDWWEKNKLEKQIAFLSQHPDYGVIGTNYINHADSHDKNVILPETDSAIKNTLFWRNPFAHSAVCYRTDLIRSAGKYNENVRYAQDYELWVRCFPRTHFYNIQEFLCHRTLGKGISVDKQNDQMRQYLKVLRVYLPKYRRPFRDYGAMIEPLLVLMLPEWIKKLKRHYLP